MNVARQTPNSFRGVSLRVIHTAPLLQVEPCDVVFGNRLNKTQQVANLSKDPVTHSAFVVEGPDGLRTIEIGPNGLLSRPFEEFRNAYRVAGFARPRMCPPCKHQMLSFANRCLEENTLRYAWDACTLLESVALLRATIPTRLEAKLIRAAEIPARRIAHRVARDGVTCSGLIDLILSSVGPCCLPEARWPRKSRVPLWRAMPTMTDLRTGDVPAQLTDPDVVRVMTSPNDLWAADFWEFRAVQMAGHLTFLFELDRTAADTGQQSNHRREMT